MLALGSCTLSDFQCSLSSRQYSWFFAAACAIVKPTKPSYFMSGNTNFASMYGICNAPYESLPPFRPTGEQFCRTSCVHVEKSFASSTVGAPLSASSRAATWPPCSDASHFPIVWRGAT